MPDYDLYIKPTHALPGFDYNREGNCRIFGNSRPDNIDGIYLQGLEYLKELASEQIPIYFTFDFDYFNTSTQKYIHGILSLLEKQPEKGSVTWIYIDIDEDALDMGKLYRDMFRSLKIKLRSKK
jgi:hypothetical protein